LDIVVAVACIYVAISIGVMNDLVKKNDELCQARQVSRTVYRTLFEGRDDWSVADQHYLDENLPPIVVC